MSNIGTLVFILLANLSSAQVHFQKSFGGSGDDRSNALLYMPNGDYVLAGYTDSHGNGSYDIFLMRTDSFGATKWFRTYGGSKSESYYSPQSHLGLDSVSDGGFVIASQTSSYGNGGFDGFLIKTNDTGGVKWAKTFGGSDDDAFNSVEQTFDGGFIVSGESHSFINNNRGDIWVNKIDKWGNLIWSRAIGGNRNDYGSTIRQDPRDSLFTLVGATYSSYTHGRADALLMKLDDNGDSSYSRVIGGSLLDLPRHITISPDGGFWVSVTSWSWGPGSSDWCLVKLNNLFEVEFGRAFGHPSGNEGVRSILIDTLKDQIIFTGNSNQYVTGSGAKDFLIVRLNSRASVIESAYQYGGNRLDQTIRGGPMLTFTKGSDIACVGRTQSFNTNGDNDIYLISADSAGKIINGCKQQKNTNIGSDTSISVSEKYVTPTFLKVKNSDVKIDSVTNFKTHQLDDINVCTPAIADFTFSPPCDGETIQFENLSYGDPTSYEWTFYDTITVTSTQEEPSYQFSSDSTFDVKLLVINANDTDSITKRVVFVSDPVVTAMNDTVICPFDTLQLKASSDELIRRYKWFPRDTLLSVIPDSPSVVISTKQDFVVEGTDTSGCSSKDTVTISMKSNSLSKPVIQCSQYIASNRLQLNWDTGGFSNDFGQWELYRIRNGTRNRIAEVPNFAVDSIIDQKGDFKDSVYGYQIRVTDICGFESPYSDTLSNIKLEADTLNDKKIALSWNAPLSDTVLNYSLLKGSDTLSVTKELADTLSFCSVDDTFQIIQSSQVCETRSSGPHVINADTTEASKPEISALLFNTSGSNLEIELKSLQKSEPDTLKILRFRSIYQSSFGKNLNGDTSFSISVNRQADEYCYRSLSLDTCGNKSDTSARFCAIDLQGKSLNLADSLSWASIPGESIDSFQLLRTGRQSSDTLLISLSSTDTQYHDTSNIACNVNYTYWLKAYSKGRLIFSSIDTTLSPFDTIKPLAPEIEKVSFDANGNLSLEIKKSPSSDVTTYEVWRKKNQGSYALLTSVQNPSGSVFSVNDNSTYQSSDSLYFKVLAVDSCNSNKSIFSSEHSPVQLSGRIGNLANTLNWKAYEGFDSVRYVVESQGPGSNSFVVLDTLDIRSYSDTGLACNKSYTYRIRAIDPLNNLESISLDTSLVPFDTIRPADVNLLSVVVQSHNEIELRFLPVTDSDVKEYKLYSSKNGNSRNLIATLQGPFNDTITYTYKGISAELDTFSFQVFAADSCNGNRSDTSEFHKVINLTGQAGNLSSSLSWNPYQGFDSIRYVIEKWDGSAWDSIVGSRDSLYTDTGLLCNRPYFYRISGYDLNTGLRTKSDSVRVIPFDTIDPAQPNTISASYLLNNGIYLQWNASNESDVDRYIVEKRITGVFTPVDTVGDTSYTDLSASTKEKECYRVRAIDSCAGNTSIPSASHCPSVLRADTVGCDQKIYLSWSAYNGFSVDEIYIYRGTHKTSLSLIDSLSGTSLSYVDNQNLIQGIQYYYRLGFRLGSDTLSYSSIDSQNTYFPEVPEIKGASKVVTSATNGEVQLEWEDVSQNPYFDHYTLYYRESASNSFSIIKDTIAGSDSSYLHQNLNTNTSNHVYYMSATDRCATESFYSDTHKTMNLGFDIGQLRHFLSWNAYEGFTPDNHILEQLVGSTWIAKDTLNSEDTSAVRFPAACNVDIIYRIKAVSANGYFVLSDTASNRAIDAVPADAPEMKNISWVNDSVVQIDYVGADSLDLFAFDIRRKINQDTVYRSQGYQLFNSPSESLQFFDTIRSKRKIEKLCYQVVSLDSCLNATASDTFCPLVLSGKEENLANSLSWPVFEGYNLDSVILLSLNPDDTLAILSQLDTSYFHSPLPCNISRSYRLIGKEQGNNRTTRSNSLMLTPFDTLRPDSPSIKYLTVKPNQTLDLTWYPSKSSDVTLYEVQWYDNNASQWTALDTVERDTTLNITSLQVASDSHEIRLVAIDSCAGNRSLASLGHQSVNLSGESRNLSNYLSWNAYKGFIKPVYVVEMQESGNWESLASTGNQSYLHDSIACNRKRIYRIRIYDSLGQFNAFSDTLHLTPFDTIKPASPKIKQVSHLSNSSIEIVFDSSSSPDVEFYNVYGKEGSSGYSLLSSISHTNGQQAYSYEHSGLNASDSQYYYFVEALDSCAGNISVNNRVHSAPQLEGNPGNLRNELQWTAYRGFAVQEYIVQRKGVSSDWNNIIQTNSTNATDSQNISCNLRYEYRVLAVSNQNDTSHSDTLHLTPFDTIDPAPVSLTSVSVINGNSVNVKWEGDTSSDQKYFEVFRNTGSGFSSIGQVTYRYEFSDQSPIAISPEDFEYYIIAIDSCSSSNRSIPSDTDRVMQLSLETGACQPEVMLSWSAYDSFETGIEEYKIWRKQTGSWSLIDSTTRLNYIDSGLQDSTTYCYRVEAISTASYTSYSDTQCIKTRVWPVPGSANLKGVSVIETGVNNGQMEVRWKAYNPNDTFARAYMLYEREDDGSKDLLQRESDLNKTRYLHSGINTRETSRTYVLRIQNLCKVEGDAESHTSVELSGKALNLSNELEWNNYLGYSRKTYTLERKQVGKTWRKINAYTANDSSFTDTFVRCGINYEYRVQTISQNGDTVYSDTTHIATFDTISSQVPDLLFTSVSLTDDSQGEINFQFSSTDWSNRKGFILYRSEGSGFTAVDTLESTKRGRLQWQNGGLSTQNIRYFYSISTLDSCGNESPQSKVHGPVFLNAEARDGEIEVSWTNYRGYDAAYTLQRRLFGGGWRTIQMVQPDDSLFIDSFITCDSLYEYRVTASANGFSSFSNTDTVKAFDQAAPTGPVLKLLSCIPNDIIQVSWLPSSSPDLKNYVIERSSDSLNWQVAQSNIPGSQSYQDSFPEELNSAWYYRLYPVDSCGNIGDTSNVHRNIFLKGRAGNQENSLSWNAYEGGAIEKYYILRQGLIYDSVQVSQLNYTDTLVLCTETYTYRIIGVINKQELSYSNSIQLQPTDKKVPKRPELLHASVVNPNNEIEISWKPGGSFDEKSIEVYRQLPGSPTKEKLRDVELESGNKLSFAIDSMQEVCYYLKTSDHCGNSSEYSNRACLMLLEAENEELENHLSWNPYSEWMNGVMKYEILREGVFGNWVKIGEVGGAELSYVDAELNDTATDFCYQVKAIPSNEVNSEGALSFSACTKQGAWVHIPNSFSPGVSAGLNDVFKPEGLYIKSFSMQIYNRWGQMVYSNDNSEGWDGTMNGQIVNTGVYLYRIQITGDNGEVEYYDGNLVIVR